MEFTATNEAWILHREEIRTTQEGTCNVYVLLDAYSGFCFGQEISINLPAPSKIVSLLNAAHRQLGAWPKKILILKKDPFVETLQVICDEVKIPLITVPGKDLQPYVRSFKDAFRQYKKGMSSVAAHAGITQEEQEELEAFVPDSYALCPCASGNKFKFCCQKIFRDLAFAMCAAQEGNLDEAFRHMKSAEDKVGRTAEVLCRYSICWSFFDMNKFQTYLQEAIRVNPKHPRANYLLGIEAVAAGKFSLAVEFYQTALDHYPAEDKFHLNETYNNLGTAYYELRKYQEAKEVWEKALVLLPSDRMVKDNLFEFIYENHVVPKDLRVMSPFIKKYLGTR